MEVKDFNNERDARIFRDSKRDEGLAASLFTYGKDRYKVKVIEPTAIKSDPKENLQRTQRWLSSEAWTVSKDIEDLTKVKEIIDSPDFGNYDYEDTLLVAKYLEKEHWFPTTRSIIDFFDYPDKEEGLVKIKEMVDTALQEYNDQWNNLD